MEKLTSTEIVVPESARGLYTEALAELETTERDQVAWTSVTHFGQPLKITNGAGSGLSDDHHQ